MKKINGFLQSAAFGVLGVAMLVQPSAHAGHIDGNGGDHIRATFLKMGEAVISYLKDSDVGAQVVRTHGLDLGRLENTLSIDVVSVDAGTLIDNGSSNVDAIGEEGKIILSKNAWAEHFEKSRDVYYLVFHEMLRAVAKNDDNYVISAPLNPFPQTRRILTRMATLFPILGEDNISQMIDGSQLSVNGTGCPLGRLGTSVDVDLERNQVEISFRRNTAETGGRMAKSLDRKNCALALPIKVPADRRLVISQVDMSAKLETKQNSKAQISLEAFVSGTRGTVEAKVLETGTLPKQGRLLLRRNEVLKSACGASAILRMNTSSVLQSRGTLSEDVNLLDVDRLSISLKTELCR